MLREEPDFIKESGNISYTIYLLLWLSLSKERLPGGKNSTKNPNEEINSGKPERCVG